MRKHFLAISKSFITIVMPVTEIAQCNVPASLTSASYYFSSVKLQRQLRVLLFCLLFGFTFLPAAQSQTPETPAAEQQLENSTETNSDNETEDDSYMQQMQQFMKHPLNLNTADEDDLKELRVLSPLQIQNFLSYRNLLGKLVDMYELQAVPGWDLYTIQKIRSFITVSNEEKIAEAVNSRLKYGEHSLLLRVSQILEKSKGYLPDSATNYYPGSPQKILLRYKYNYKNLLQYGIVAEKDAGEQFFKGKQKQGFDFYSAHFFIRNAGKIKTLAIGDFTINLGQGLIQWQSLAFKKSADVISIKRESEIIRPYNSSGEIYFHRGAAATIKTGNLQTSFFISYKKIDANFVTDSLLPGVGFVTSFQTSGYHRTKSETDDKGKQQQLAFGGSISYKHKGLKVAANTVQYKFKLPLQKEAAAYALYTLSGNGSGNYSVDYAYTLRNIHFFGEAAINNNRYPAFVSGLLISTSSLVDMSLLYRNISPGYQSLYSSSFTENSSPANEKGLYAGISVHPGPAWRLDAYADFYKFPWLKYQVNAPSDGKDFMLQLTYKPNKQVEFYSRYRAESKAGNSGDDNLVLQSLTEVSRKNWRTQLSFKINPAINLRHRMEIVWLNKVNKPDKGFLGYSELLCKPPQKKWSIIARALIFETGGYDSRLYAYESDVLYSNSIPAFYDKGVRYYLAGSYDMNKKLTLWFRWSQTRYRDKNIVGSGLDGIPGARKTEFKLQARYFF